MEARAVTSLLAARELTPEERAAHDEEPRPGVWAGEDGADLRALTQDETDGLIRRMLYAAAAPGERDELVAAVSVPRGTLVLGPPSGRKAAHSQRGGIDSDPLVRLLAYRAWGDRDRRWFELRGVRKGEAITTIQIGDGCLGAALPWVGEIAVALAGRDARPGERVDLVVPDAGSRWLIVSDRLRPEPERVLAYRAGGDRDRSDDARIAEAEKRLSGLFKSLQDFPTVSAWCGPPFEYDLHYHELLDVRGLDPRRAARLRRRALVAMLLACLNPLEEHYSMGLAADRSRCLACLDALAPSDADEARLVGIVRAAFEAVARRDALDNIDMFSIDRDARWVHARFVKDALDELDASTDDR